MNNQSFNTIPDNGITTKYLLSRIIEKISFDKLYLNLNWKFETKEVYTGSFGEVIGWLIRANFERPDIETGIITETQGQWEFIPFGETENFIIKKCFYLLELSLKNELMEMFLVNDARVFFNHKSMEYLKD